MLSQENKLADEVVAISCYSYS